MVEAKKVTPKKKAVKKIVDSLGDGWVSVEGLVDPYVGTGLTGDANKIKLGEKVNLPVVLAKQLLAAKQVKEIK